MNTPIQTPIQALPLFPLGTVLFPGGILPLQIFEVRYLDLVRRCLREGSPFGIISLLEGHEVRKPAEQVSLARFGTLVHVDECEALSPALLRIRCKASQRFELLDAEQQQGGLWVGRVRVLDTEPDIALPDDLASAGRRLGELLESLEEQNVAAEQWPFDKPYKLTDCAWVANRWCEILPMNKDTKLQMLALDNPLIRLELVNDVLIEQGLV
ncbi:LON peptidase substrate-binding domain-containing protein [Limnobacter humi]|uniref:LON peptidase substrate-binding domain-containing protein n=1 Tax=Limnobacter humi TaxID=1778671 RepID=A0ABT1WG28_9BURK|nr:LON peptidase substrate-binding domain-containing protein [Limnobacter humi]MCQ8896476.1 LON peptidase substrate-binding domain-containing protein [Limnobacter humi]